MRSAPAQKEPGVEDRTTSTRMLYGELSLHVKIDTKFQRTWGQTEPSLGTPETPTSSSSRDALPRVASPRTFKSRVEIAFFACGLLRDRNDTPGCVETDSR